MQLNFPICSSEFQCLDHLLFFIIWWWLHDKTISVCMNYKTLYDNEQVYEEPDKNQPSAQSLILSQQ